MDDVIKFLVDVLLKEYDSLRKEIDVRTDATKTYGWPVIFLAAGTFAGWKTLLNIDMVFFLLPAVAMFIVSLGTNAAHNMDKVRVGLARIENRIYELTGYMLVANESCRLIARHKHPWRPLHIALFVIEIFFFTEACLYNQLDIHNVLCYASPKNESNTARTIVLWMLITAPALFYLFSAAIWSYQLRAKIKFTPLMTALQADQTCS